MKIKVGNIFSFSVAEDAVATGQVVAKDASGIPLYVVIFEPMYKSAAIPALTEVASQKIILLGGTMDSRFKTGDWRLLGDAPLDMARIPLPNCKVGDGNINNHIIESFDRRRSRKATGDDLVLYEYRTSVAPIRFEKAFKAYHLKEGWSEHFEKLLLDFVTKRAVPL